MFEYDIYFKNSTVGQAQVYVDGLYTCFRCVCTLPESDVFRVRMKIGEKKFDIGVCMPMNGSYVAMRRISTRQLCGGKMAFEIVPIHDTQNSFLPLNTMREFHYISKLDKATLSVVNGEKFIVIVD